MRLVHMSRRRRMIVGNSIAFMLEAVLMGLPEVFFSPESHGHQPRHIKRGARRRNCSDNPQQPSNGNVSSRNSPPQNFILRPETAERNDAANRQPSGHEREVGPGHILPQP